MALLFDLWGTLIYSKEADEDKAKLIERIKGSTPYQAADFFRDWKELWFKQGLSKAEFVFRMKAKYPLIDTWGDMLECATFPSAEFIYVFPDAIETLDCLIAQGHRLGLVSDCGRDGKNAVLAKGLGRYFQRMFFSFEHCTTKDEFLYAGVCMDLQSWGNLYMIGDDPRRDYIIPNEYGITSILLDRKSAYTAERRIQTLSELKHLKNE